MIFYETKIIKHKVIELNEMKGTPT